MSQPSCGDNFHPLRELKARKRSETLKPSLCAIVDLLGFKEQLKSAYNNNRERDLLRTIRQAM